MIFAAGQFSGFVPSIRYWRCAKIAPYMHVTDILLAQKRIRPYVKRTPLERSETLSRRLGTNVFAKYELFQKTGSFKARGAFNKLLSLNEDDRRRGIVAVSGGNHAQ